MIQIGEGQASFSLNGSAYQAILGTQIDSHVPYFERAGACLGTSKMS